MTGADLFQAMMPVLKAFDQLGVKHYVGGSVASSAFGLPRTTLDADLIAVLNVRHVDSLVSALSSEFYVSGPMVRGAIENESSFHVVHLATMFKIDVFVAKSRPFDQSALSRIRRDSLGDPEDELEVWLPSPEDVVLSKLEWYRLGDEASQRQWTDVLGVLKVQRDKLDKQYLQYWARELAISDLIDRALSEATTV